MKITKEIIDFSIISLQNSLDRVNDAKLELHNLNSPKDVCLISAKINIQQTIMILQLIKQQLLA